MKSNPPHKQQNKKKKILLGTLIPLAIVGVALAVALPLTMCKRPGSGGGDGPTPTPPEPPTPTPPAHISRYLTMSDPEWSRYFTGDDFTTNPWKVESNDQGLAAQIAFMKQSKFDGLDLTGIKNGEIADRIFNGCMPMNGRIINIKGEGITNIGDQVFCGCSGLKSIEFNETQASVSTNLDIGVNAFEGCVNVEHFGFGSTIKSISSCAFMGCKLKLDDAKNIINKKIDQTAAGISKLIGTNYALLWKASEKSASAAGCGCVAAGNVLDAQDVTDVGANGFSGCAGITLTPISSVNYLSPTRNPTDWVKYFANTNSCTFAPTGTPDYDLMKQTTYNGIDFGSLTSIDGSTPFKGCAAFNGRITHIKSENITSIPENSFMDCGSLEDVQFTKCADAKSNSFKECANLQNIVLYSSAGFAIGAGTFYGTKINLPNTKELVEHCTVNVAEKHVGDDYAFMYNEYYHSANADGCVAWGNIFKDSYWSTDHAVIEFSSFAGCAGIDLWI